MTTSSETIKTLTKYPFKIAVISDIHLGHRRTPTSHIVNNLIEVFKDEKEIASWDMFVIPGDLLDRLLSFNEDEAIAPIMLFGRILLKMCRKHDIVLRVLEGTPGHDRKQSRFLTYLKDAMLKDDELDFKYIEELAIEYIPKFNINVLYVPDEWHHDVVETYNDALELMNQRGLKQVDFCFFHGAFNYQINEQLNPKAHSEELWSSLVKYYLFAGHVHYRSQYKNIVVPGSFDRLAHGEEGEKGWVSCTIIDEDNHDLRFHENKNAMKYITVDVRNEDRDNILAKVDEVVKTLPNHSHVRLWVTNRSVLKDALDVVKKTYSYIHFSLKVDAGKKELREKTLKLVTNEFQPIELTKENIPRLVGERLTNLADANINVSAVLNLLSTYL